MFIKDLSRMQKTLLKKLKTIFSNREIWSKRKFLAKAVRSFGTF